MISDSLKKKLEERIRALLAKTQDSGCTEAEAMAAAEKAKELIDKYQIEVGADALVEEGMIKGTYRTEGQIALLFEREIWLSLSQYCEVRVMNHTKLGRAATITRVAGLPSDVQFYCWLIQHLSSFVERGATEAATAEKARVGYVDVKAFRRAFAMGAGSTIRARLKDMIQARKAAVTSGSTALVVIDKKGMLDAFVGPQTFGRSYSNNVRSGSGYSAGQAHGAKASFGRPVGSGGGALRIGRS